MGGSIGVQVDFHLSGRQRRHRPLTFFAAFFPVECSSEDPKWLLEFLYLLFQIFFFLLYILFPSGLSNPSPHHPSTPVCFRASSAPLLPSLLHLSSSTNSTSITNRRLTRPISPPSKTSILERTKVQSDSSLRLCRA
jgi:hypothetical protein